MIHLTIEDLYLFLKDLLGNRAADLMLSSLNTVYRPLLESVLRNLETLPDLVRGRPLSQELADTDANHDAAGRALAALFDALEQHPLVPAAIRARAGELRTSFIPSLVDLKASYADEAAAALRGRERLEALREELKQLALPDGNTLYTWLAYFLDQGVELDRLLRLRAERSLPALGPGGALPPSPAMVRIQTLGLLGRLRATLADELVTNQTLPRDLDSRLFGYLDQLAQARAQSAASAATPGTGEGATAADAGAPATQPTGSGPKTTSGETGTPT